MIAQVGKLISRWYSIPLLLLLWQVAVGSGLVESRLLPSPARVWAELVTDPELGQVREAPGQARVWDWAEHPARQQLVQVLVTSPLPATASPWFPYHHQSHTCHGDCR